MTLSSSKLTLYPANWLYNAGVVGFLRVLDAMGEDVEGMLREDGGVEVEGSISPRKYWETMFDIFINEILGDKKRDEWINDLEKFQKQSGDRSNIWKLKVKKVWGTLFNAYSRGFFNANTKELNPGDPNNKLWKNYERFFHKALSPYKNGNSNLVCSFCGRKLDDDEVNEGFHKPFLTSEHNKLLGASPSLRGMPNSFWDLKPNNVVCSTCAFMMIHYFIPLIRISGGSQIFINAPSFKIMWYLNRYAREIYGREKAERVEQILGMSLIEMTLRLNRELSRWTAMNIEVVLKRGDDINFFSLPYEVVRIITNRKVASLLSRINRYDVLNLVLKGDFEGILRMGERMLREGMNSENKGEIEVSQKLFQLHAAISDALKEEVEYDRCANL